MWRCPKCGADLVQKNLWHSCGNFSVAAFLEGKTPRAVELFQFFINAWNRIGPIKLHPVKTSVSLLVDVRFARVNRVTRDAIVGHLWLKKKIDSDKFFKAEKLGSNDYIHHFKMTDESFIDDEFIKYMKMAYAIGERNQVRDGNDAEFPPAG